MSVSEIRFDIANQAALVRALLHQIAASSGDDETVQIVADSETTLIDAITAALNRIGELEAHADVMTNRIDNLRARRDFFRASVIGIRASILSALETCGTSKLETPEATVYLRATPDRVEITDATIIPLNYMRQPEPVIDKAELSKQVKLGVVVPGASLIKGGNTIAIRR